jgi:hypothetical protein
VYSGASLLPILFASYCSFECILWKCIISGDFYVKAESEPQGRIMTAVAHCPFFLPVGCDSNVSWELGPLAVGSFPSSVYSDFWLPSWDCWLWQDWILCCLSYCFKLTKNNHHGVLNYKFIFKYLFQPETSDLSCKFSPAVFLLLFLMT